MSYKFNQTYKFTYHPYCELLKNHVYIELELQKLQCSTNGQINIKIGKRCCYDMDECNYYLQNQCENISSCIKEAKNSILN